MKPAGSERDIVIAKLKGYEIKTNPSGDYYVDNEGDMHWAHNSYWSTDRNSAWELWDELRGIHKIYRQMGDKHFVEAGIDETHKLIRFDGTSFADCVSQAWIKFKEATR